jgi:hypothetical protein
MNRLVLTSCLVLSCFTGCLGVGTGVQATDTRPVGSFHAVDIASGVQAALVVGPAPSLVLTGDQGVIEHLRTVVDAEGRLSIALEPGLTMFGDERVVATLTTPAIDAVSASGASTLSVSGLRGALVSVSASGASNVSLAGEVARVALTASGSGEVDARAVPAEEVTVDLSGASRARVSAARSVSGALHGSSRLEVVGQPVVDVRTEGSSSVGAL